jgi:predicted ester cyclase
MLMISARRERRWQGGRSSRVGRRGQQSPGAPHIRRSLQPEKLDSVDELLSAAYVDHTVPSGKYAGREGFKRSVARQRASSSDLHITIEEQIAEGDKVVTWVIGGGIHDRERFMGLAPTGERMTMKHIISRVVEGNILAEWGVSDVSAMWQRRLQREDRTRAHEP